MKWWREGGIGSWPNTAWEIIHMINVGRVGSAFSGKRMIGFAFGTIDYGLDVFLAVDGDGDVRTKDEHKMERIRERCEVVFDWEEDGVVTRLEGVMRVRDVSGVGSWQFLDTLHSATSPRGVMCKRHTSLSGFPVYHGQGYSCPVNTAIDDADRVQPTILRLARDTEQRPPVKKGKERKERKKVDARDGDDGKFLCVLLSIIVFFYLLSYAHKLVFSHKMFVKKQNILLRT
jgi:hypothetical protein